MIKYVMQSYHIVQKTADGEIVYTLILHYKKMKNIVFRPSSSEPNTFNVSVPLYTKLPDIDAAFYKLYPKLVKLLNKVKEDQFDGKLYVFGVLSSIEDVTLKYHFATIPSTKESFYKMMHKVTMDYLKSEVMECAKVMNIPIQYKVRLRKMKTRWGTNSSRTNTLTFNEAIIHYHPHIIKSLVIHELAHYYIKGHKSDFYVFVESYFPNYKRVDKLLKERHYEYHY